MSEVDLTVANTILQQLGGRRFILMTGAKDFVGDANSLMFRIGKNSGGVSKVKIILEPSDTYRVIFYRIRQTRKTAAQITIVHEADDIYFDQLPDLFKRITGLETQMPRILGLEQRSNPPEGKRMMRPEDLCPYCGKEGKEQPLGYRERGGKAIAYKCPVHGVISFEEWKRETAD